MTSRERVIRAMNHEPVDRVPIDLGSHMSTGISMFAYWRLREHLGLSTNHIRIPDMVQCLAYRRFCEFLHANSDIKVFLHNCGSIKPLIPMLIEAGIDVLNPVQISAVNMDPQELKDDFGDKMCFWGGGCDTQSVLGVCTPEDVKDNVRKLMRTFKKDSGFVFNQVHNIMGNVPAENIVAMLDTAYAESFC